MKKKEKVSSVSLLSRGLKIKGDISGNENFKIEGTIKGSVKVSGDVLVEETGAIEAHISGNNIVVKGLVNGNISATGRLEIHTTGIVIGDISARSIDIQEGAKFEGRSHMLQSGNTGDD
ncbi:MAG: polymer-forming cytoskeletal protein, partial [Desulfobacterales bacterium]|nr:polymer-forming cytoskeletal protein [Desulfobacterales bacterium]